MPVMKKLTCHFIGAKLIPKYYNIQSFEVSQQKGLSVYSLDYTGGGGRRPPLAAPCCFPDTWQRRWQRRRLTSNPWVPSRRAPWTYKAVVQVGNYLTLLPNNPHTEKKLCDLVTSSMNVFVWQILNFQPNANLLVSITVDKHFTTAAHKLQLFIIT